MEKEEDKKKVMQKKMKKKEVKEFASDLLQGTFTRIPAKYSNNYSKGSPL